MTRRSQTPNGTSTSTGTSDSNADPTQVKPRPRRRQVTLVFGPPCAGKSHFVNHHKGLDDTVLDIDLIAQKLGSPVHHGHTGSMYGNAEKVFQAMLRQIRAARTGTFWVIRCGAEPHVRRELATLVRATQSFVLIPPIQVAANRARLRDAGCGATISAISGWFARYQPDGFSRVIRS